MASSQNTGKYRLPIFAETDKPTWLGDFNEAMRLLDTHLTNLELAINALSSQVVNLQNRVTTLEGKN